MNTAVIVGALLIAVVVVVLLLKASGAKRQTETVRAPVHTPPPPEPVRHLVPAPAPADAQTRVAAEPTPSLAPLPAELLAFQRTRVEQLTPQLADVLLGRLRDIPRPPRSLQKLVSPEFLQTATSVELSELILAEPHIAAKVLATVNSPFYGLQQPVASIGQGVTFLGLNTVRGICLQYLLNDAFKPGTPELKRVFDTVWTASAMASELCSRLSQRLGLRDPGTLVTQVVLSFLGHLAALSLLPPERAGSLAGQDLLSRSQAEQAELGLTACAMGELLLRSWELPATVVQGVTDIDRVLETPVTAMDPTRAPALALCYLCARLGEQLAFGSLPDLASYDPTQDSRIDMACLQGYLAQPALARLPELLQAPDLGQVIGNMLTTLRT